jgi:mutator protein MutT
VRVEDGATCGRDGRIGLKRLHGLSRALTHRASRVLQVMKRVVAAVIEKNGKLLVCQRTRDIKPCRSNGNFLGGKIEEGEQPRDALRRELEEELGIHAKVGDEIARVQHTYPNGAAVELRFFIVREYDGDTISSRVEPVEERSLLQLLVHARSQSPSPRTPYTRSTAAESTPQTADALNSPAANRMNAKSPASGFIAPAASAAT